ncbi:MAG: hypothetical protein KDC44_25045, partial [Phaeodactylibacter sp.]|nr:hypothetical protein [Phaeodactylibacter sp.]
MKSIHFFIPAIAMLAGCTSHKGINKSELTSSPEEISQLVIEELLSRQEFAMYDVEEVHALHYAEVCTAYGAVKVAASLKDKNTIQRVQERYDRIEEEEIPNTANHVDANVYGILPLELYLHNNDRKYLDQGIALADGQWRDPLPNGL